MALAKMRGSISDVKGPFLCHLPFIFSRDDKIVSVTGTSSNESSKLYVNENGECVDPGCFECFCRRCQKSFLTLGLFRLDEDGYMITSDPDESVELICNSIALF